MQDKKDPPEQIWVIETQYLCGASIGFACNDADVAARKAAAIMTDICPECKQEAGIELTQDDLDILSINPASHAKAQEN
jgi:hypothetical protein